MLTLFIHKIEVVFELLKEGYILVKWGVCNVIIVHLVKPIMNIIIEKKWNNLIFIIGLTYFIFKT